MNSRLPILNASIPFYRCTPNRNMKISLLLSCIVCVCSSLFADTFDLSNCQWKLRNALNVNDAPAAIAQAGYDDRDWIPAQVPGTVLGSYVADGKFPDPWFGDNMDQIPDEMFSGNDFWYRCSFVIPPETARKHLWLNFDGINWKAEVFLNGSAIGRIDGAFIRGHFDVTQVAKTGATNDVAVLIRHCENWKPGPKKVLHKTLGGRTSNGDVLGADSPAFLASAGWNWLPIVRGRNIGIWNKVRLETSGDVEIVDHWVISDLPNPDQADLTVKTELHNVTTVSQHGRLVGRIGDISFSQEVTLGPNESKSVTIDKSVCPGLSISHPRLWWPNGYGGQPLYKLSLSFEIDRKVSDSKSLSFGIRKITYETAGKALKIYVNGCRILIRGGNWGMAEGLLRCDASGYDTLVRLHRDANLNMIRNWVGMVGDDAFYDACDRYGILVWDDFWLANPLDGPVPLDNKMFLANVDDKIRRVRSHTSLALYCGRNEGNPPAELDAGMRAALKSLDDTRYYLPSSADGVVTGRGPYANQDADWYFKNRGKTLHSELGIVAIPALESMREMMPEKDLWPINAMWAVHDYQTGRSQLNTKRIAQRYGEPADIGDYCRKAQMVNLETAKAMMECAQANQGGGILIWMTQAAWPSLICQLYDYYFEPTAAFFGVKSGSEPVHVFWDSNADVIKAANNTPKDLKELTAEAAVYSLDGIVLWRKSIPLDMPESSVRDCFPITRPTDSSPVFFVKLSLRQGEKRLSDNFYWSCAKGGTCAALNQLPPVKLEATAVEKRKDGVCRFSVTTRNLSQAVALAIRLKVQRAKSGKRVLPVFYEDNYYSLLPGEDRTVVLEFNEKELDGEAPKILAEGWNIPLQEVTIQ